MFESCHEAEDFFKYNKIAAKQKEVIDYILQLLDFLGEPCGDRTHDHLIKSQVLYH